MSDTPLPDDQTRAMPAGEHEIEVDLAAFLPEGVTLASDADEVEPADELDEVEPADEAPLAVAPSPTAEPSIDLDALSQIERDLDAVDAAIAALDAGTYGLDPATGRPLDDALLAEDPTRLS